LVSIKWRRGASGTRRRVGSHHHLGGGKPRPPVLGRAGRRNGKRRWGWRSQPAKAARAGWPGGRSGQRSILRQAAEPLTSRDIALELLVTRALDKDDQKLLALMTKRVGVTLRLQRVNGIVRSSSGPGQYMVWEIAR
jgi:hypothetical protein